MQFHHPVPEVGVWRELHRTWGTPCRVRLGLGWAVRQTLGLPARREADEAEAHARAYAEAVARSGPPPAILAARSVDGIDRLVVAEGADVNARDVWGGCALLWWWQNPDATAALLRHGARVDDDVTLCWHGRLGTQPLVSACLWLVCIEPEAPSGRDIASVSAMVAASCALTARDVDRVVQCAAEQARRASDVMGREGPRSVAAWTAKRVAAAVAKLARAVVRRRAWTARRHALAGAAGEGAGAALVGAEGRGAER